MMLPKPVLDRDRILQFTIKKKKRGQKKKTDLPLKEARKATFRWKST